MSQAIQDPMELSCRFEKADGSKDSPNPGSTQGASSEAPRFFQFVERLRGCAASLKKACKQTEPDFLRLGDELQSLHAEAAELTRKVVGALDGYGTGSDNRILEQAVAHARGALSELEEDRKRIVENLSGTEAIIQELHKLTNAGAMLQKIAKSLKVIAINIGIESARFDEAQGLFGPLAAEIRSLSEEVKKTAAIVSEDTESTIRSLSEVRNEMHRRIEQLTEWALEAEQTLEATLPQVEESFRFTAQVLTQAGKNAGKVSQLVGEIVVGIQIHDNISQRADHIAEALRNAESHCDANHPDGRIYSSDSLKAVRSIVRLQSAQLELLIRDVESAYDTHKASFSELKQVVDETTQMVSGIDAFETDTGSSSSNLPPGSAEACFDTIQQALQRIHFLLGQGAEARLRIGTAMDRATESADKLSGHMGAIRNTNFDIHLKALNAIVHSLHLGVKGKTFAVLVTEIKDRAVESDGFVSCVEKIIDKIEKETAAVGSRGRNQESLDSEGSSGRLLEKSIVEFSSACDIYRENAQIIPIIGGSLRRNITDTITRLEFLDALSEKLSGNLENIEEAQKDLPPPLEGETAASDPDMETLSDRYTMQQERSVHEIFLSRRGFSEALPATGIQKGAVFESVQPSISKEDVDDSLGDNVELF